MTSSQSWILICLVALAAIESKVSEASRMPETLPKQTVSAGSTVEIKATDSTGAFYRWCVFGFSNPNDINPSPSLLTVDNYKDPARIENGTKYDSRVSFFGELDVGRAWFRITNVKESDSNTYEMRCYARDGKFFYPKMELEVLPDSEPSRMPEALPKQTVSAGSTVEIKATDSTGAFYRWCVFGFSNPNDINPSPSLLTVDNYKDPARIENGTKYDSRVSFFGELDVGRAWFRITNVKESDSNTYEMRCYARDGKFFYPKMELEVLPVDEWQPLGCYRDSGDRTLPVHYAHIAFDGSPGGFKRMFEECKKGAEEKGFEYFAIQHKTECWGSPNGQEITYNKHGCKNNCLRSDDGYGIGAGWSNFVYRLKKDWSDCKDGFQYKLVSKQDTCYECPAYNIKIEKSETKREC